MDELVQPFRTQGVLFLGEQDGPSERTLKSELLNCFNNDEVIKNAYLVRVSLKETPSVGVALCLYPDNESRDSLLQCIAGSFKKIFHATVHMDILFLNDAQKSDIDRVAKPFFQRTTP